MYETLCSSLSNFDLFLSGLSGFLARGLQHHRPSGRHHSGCPPLGAAANQAGADRLPGGVQRGRPRLRQRHHPTARLQKRQCFRPDEQGVEDSHPGQVLVDASAWRLAELEHADVPHNPNQTLPCIVNSNPLKAFLNKLRLTFSTNAADATSLCGQSNSVQSPPAWDSLRICAYSIVAEPIGNKECPVTCALDAI